MIWVISSRNFRPQFRSDFFILIITLFSKSSIARAPDGNGGIYAALKREGILQHMRQNGVSCCHVYCVDNSLVKGIAEYRILIHYLHDDDLKHFDIGVEKWLIQHLSVFVQH